MNSCIPLPQKLLAEAKTQSILGEMMPGYEDDTLELKDVLIPRASLARMRHPFGDNNDEERNDEWKAGRGFRSQTLSRLTSLRMDAISSGVMHIPEMVGEQVGKWRIPRESAQVRKWRERGETELGGKSPLFGSEREVEGGGVGCGVAREGTQGSSSDRSAASRATETMGEANGERGVREGERERVEDQGGVPMGHSGEKEEREGAQKSRDDDHDEDEKEADDDEEKAEEEGRTEEEEEKEHKLVYEFLWNDRELINRVARSSMYPLLEKQVSTCEWEATHHSLQPAACVCVTHNLRLSEVH